MPESLTDAALDLAAAGLPVFPCAESKRPITPRGFYDAATDPAIVGAMFSAPSAALIGVPTGRVSGWYVVDIDVKAGASGMAWLKSVADRIVETRAHRTQSGGYHLIFALPEGAEPLRNSASRVAPGVDVRGNGGYVIVPPSPGYGVADDADIATMPDWLYAACAEARAATYNPPATIPRVLPPGIGGTPYGLAALASECDAIRNAPDGEKHATINKAAYSIGGLVASGQAERSAAYAALSAALESIRPRCRDFRAASRTLDRAFAEGAGAPREVPDAIDDAYDDSAIAEYIAGLQRESDPVAPPVAPDIMAVSGVLREIVDSCVATAIRPQPFLALGAAICCVGALAGRKYRTETDLRTNVYVVAIAESGAGKDHPAEVVRKAIDAAGLGRYLGGETIASGRAVLSSMEQHPSRLFQIDEFGLFLAAVTGKRTPSHKAEIWSELMKLYSRAKGTYRGTEYANKKEHPRIDIIQPCAALYGTTTPHTFWRALEGGAMADGSLARFLLFATDNHRPPRADRPGIFAPSDGLVATLRAIARGAGGDHGADAGNIPDAIGVEMVASDDPSPHIVPMELDAIAAHNAGLAVEDDWAAEVVATPAASIVARLGENAAKLALIAAISDDPARPVITERHTRWGWALAEHCARTLIRDARRYIADSEFESRLNRAMNIIREHGPCSARQLFRFGLRLSPRDQADVIGALLQAGAISAAPPDGAGRPTVRYIATGG